MKKNLVLAFILTVAIVAGIYNLPNSKVETVQMQSTLQQTKPAQPVAPVIVPVKIEAPKEWDPSTGKFNPTSEWFAVDGKGFFMTDAILTRYGKYWIDSTQINGMVKVLKSKEAMRDKAREYFTGNPEQDRTLSDRAFDWNSPTIYKGVTLAEFQVWADGKMYCPLAEVLAVEGYPVTYGVPNKFASVEHDKMEKEWLKYTRIGEALKYSEALKAGYFKGTKYPLTKELFKPQPMYDMIKESVYEIPDMGYVSNNIAGNFQTVLRSNNNANEDIYIKLDKSLLSEKIPYTGSFSYHEDFPYLGIVTNYTKAGEEIYYFGTRTREITQGKYKGWKWVLNSNVIFTPADESKQDGLALFGNWYEILLLPVGTKLTVQNYWGGMPDEQITITNQVFKPLWDINNPTK